MTLAIDSIELSSHDLAPTPAPRGRNEDREVSISRACDAPPILRRPPVIQAEARVPTRHGSFRFLVFRPPEGPSKDHVSLVMGDVQSENVVVRIHSECITSEVFGSLRCDCALQLDAALQTIAHCGRGVVVYLRQEGRGIGLANKVRAYALQERGLDTVDANRALGLPDDARDYRAAAAILRELGVRSVRLLTNNPAKLQALAALGVPTTREPLAVSPHPPSLQYLLTKRARMNHLLP